MASDMYHNHTNNKEIILLTILSSTNMTRGLITLSKKRIRFDLISSFVLIVISAFAVIGIFNSGNQQPQFAEDNSITDSQDNFNVSDFTCEDSSTASSEEVENKYLQELVNNTYSKQSDNKYNLTQDIVKNYHCV